MLTTETYTLLAGAAWKSAVILGTAALCAVILRGRTASVRHLVWTGAFAAIIAMPILSLLLPAWSGPVSSAMLPEIPLLRTSVSTKSTSTEASLVPALHVQQATTPPVRSEWPFTVLLLWAAGATWSATRLLAGTVAMSRIRSKARPLQDSQVAHLARMLSIPGQIELLETQPGTMPVACGWFRPAVLLPADAARWTTQRRRVVLLHELAHIRRSDVATHFVARIALCLYWWNPLAWIAWRELQKERERAADDLVLAAGTPPADYASHLLEIARTMQTPHALAGAAVGMARQSQLEGRLRAILDSGRKRASVRNVPVLTVVLIASALVAPLAALRAQQPNTSGTLSTSTLATLDAAAQAAIEKGDLPGARQLLQDALILRGKESGPQSKAYALGWSHLGDLARYSDHAEAVKDYTQAQTILGDDPEAAPALTYLGIAAIGNKEYEKAVKWLQRAQLAGASSSASATAVLWTAIARDKQGQPAEADTLFRKALWQRHGYPNNNEAAWDQTCYANFLSRQGRDAEAATVRHQIEQERTNAAGLQTISQRADVYRVGNEVSSPQTVSKIDPKYTEEARLAQLQGTVVLRVEIGPDGLPRSITPIGTVGLGLDQAAVAAVHQWKFQPGLKNGEAVAVAATIEVNFRLLD